MIQKTQSGHDSTSRTITRKGMQDIRRKIPAYADPFYRPPPKPTETPTQVIPRKVLDSDIDSLEQDINTDFEKNSPHQEGVISAIYQRPDKSHFQEPPELQSLVNTGKLVQMFLPKQADINKILKINTKKSSKRLHIYL